jgi:AraC family transcriptional regulator
MTFRDERDRIGPQAVNLGSIRTVPRSVALWRGLPVDALDDSPPRAPVLWRGLLQFDGRMATRPSRTNGGLAAWQQKRVADYIEQHVADRLPLATLAALARLSPYHFARAFRRSFGMPPHRYHIGRRIERAKGMLAKLSLSVTEIGQRLGFSQSSAFTKTFRRLTGRTPSDFRRRPQ